MPTPSNRSGIPTVPVIALLGLILFLGFALAPGAFEFRAWPEPSRPGPVEGIVARPAEQAVEVPVVTRVKARRDDVLGVVGRNPRKPAPAREAREVRLDARGTAAPRGSRRGQSRGSHDGGSASDVPAVVVEVPAQEPPVAPVAQPEQPAQLAEVPSTGVVMRPEAEELQPEHTPEPLDPYVPGGDDDDPVLQALTDRVLEILPIGRGDRGHRGHSHGRHGRR